MKSSVVAADRKEHVDAALAPSESAGATGLGAARRARRGTGPRPAASADRHAELPLDGLGQAESSEYGRLTTSKRGSVFSQSSSFWISLRLGPRSPRSIDTVISPRLFGSTLIWRCRREPQRPPSSPTADREASACDGRAAMLLEVDTDAAEEDAGGADVRLVGRRRRVDGRQDDVVTAPQQRRGSALSRRQLPQYMCRRPR